MIIATLIRRYRAFLENRRNRRELERLRRELPLYLQRDIGLPR